MKEKWQGTCRYKPAQPQNFKLKLKWDNNKIGGKELKKGQLKFPESKLVKPVEFSTMNCVIHRIAIMTSFV